MPRIKLQQRPSYEFHYEVTVQPRDINFGGHLGNDALVTLIGEARANLFRSLGYSESDLGDGATAIIMTDLVVNYRGEGFMFDELRIESHIGEMSHNSFRLFHRVTKGDELVALAETGLMAFNYAHRRIAIVPRVFVETVNIRQKEYAETVV